MPNDIKYKIGIGKLGDDITADIIPVELVGFTFDRTDLFFDSTLRTFDET